MTDKLGLYGAAKKNLGLHAAHERGLRQNNRCENSIVSNGVEGAAAARSVFGPVVRAGANLAPE
jgi:hypothetical protein